MDWGTKEELTDQVVRILSDNNYDPDKIDASILARCLDDGRNEVISRLCKRGYTTSQIDSWPRRKEYQLDIGTYYALNRMAFPRGDEEDWIVFFDRREELDEVSIIDESGTLLEPTDVEDEVFTVFDVEEINGDLNIEP